MVIIGLVKKKNYHPVSEEIMKRIGFKSKCKINKMEVTEDEDTLTSICIIAENIFDKWFFRCLKTKLLPT